MIGVDYYIEDERDHGGRIIKNEGEEKWRELFDKYDQDGFGEISINLLPSFLAEGVKSGCISEYQTKQILQKSGCYEESPNDPAEVAKATITLQRLTELRTRKRSLSFKCAIHERDGEVQECFEETARQTDGDTTSINIVPKPMELCNQMKLIDFIAKEVLTDDTDLMYYKSRSHRNKCNPQGIAVFLPIISSLQVLIYISKHLSQNEGISELLDFRHYSPQEAWRFLSYGMLYSNLFRLVFDVGRQLTVGIALELVKFSKEGTVFFTVYHT